MKITIRKKLIASFGTFVLLFVGFGIVAFNSISNVHERFRFVVEHDAPVIANGNRLLTLIGDMETGQRGYCITLKEEFLKPYNNAVEEFRELIELEKNLVSDNPSQVEALERIEDLVGQWHEKAAIPAIKMARKAATHVVNARHLQDVLREGIGKELMDRFTALAHEVHVSFSGREDWEGAFVVEMISKRIADREDAQRGFLVTGKEEFLDKYYKGEHEKLPEMFARLRAIVSERGREDELSEKINQLEQLAGEWTRKAAEPEIAARREMKKHPETLKDIAALLEAGTGKALVDKIRAEFAMFIKIEEELSAQRYSRASQTTLNVRKITIWLVILSIIFGSTVAMVIIQGMTSSIGKLLKGTEIIGSGDLRHRIELKRKDEIGQLTVAFNQMVDKREQMEAELRRLSKVFTDGTAPTIIEDLEGNVITVNDEAVTAYGWSRQELIGQPIKRLVPEDNHEQADELLGSCRAGEVVRNVEGIRQRKDGTQIPVLLTLSLLTDEKGNPLGIATIAQDITERKKSEMAVQRERDNLTNIFSSIEDGVCIVDKDYNIQYTNPALLKEFGSIEGRKCYEYFQDRKDVCPWCNNTDVLAGKSVHWEWRSEKTGKTYDLVDTPVNNPDGTVSKLEILRDITERKQAEAELKEKTKEMETLLRTVSHDLRSPLVNIDGFSGEMVADCEHLTETLKDVTVDEKTKRDIETLLSEEIPESLNFIRTAVGKMDSLLKGLSELAKIGRVKLNIQPLDINNLFQQVVEVTKFSAEEANATIELESLPDCLGDEMKINQVFSNLVGNAIKYLDPDRPGRIRVWGKVAGDYSQYCVEDNGIGIPDYHKSKIFEIFHRVDPKGSVSGEGLGLTTTKQIVDRHKGRIWLESKKGRGSKFFISLPRV